MAWYLYGAPLQPTKRSSSALFTVPMQWKGRSLFFRRSVTTKCVLLHHFMGACICTHEMIQHVPKFIFCPNTNMNPTDMMQCPALDTFWIWAGWRLLKEEQERRERRGNRKIMAKSKLINDSDGDDDPDTRALVRHAMHEIGAVAAAAVPVAE